MTSKQQRDLTTDTDVPSTKKSKVAKEKTSDKTRTSPAVTTTTATTTTKKVLPNTTPITTTATPTPPPLPAPTTLPPPPPPSSTAPMKFTTPPPPPPSTAPKAIPLPSPFASSGGPSSLSPSKPLAPLQLNLSANLKTFQAAKAKMLLNKDIRPVISSAEYEKAFLWAKEKYNTNQENLGSESTEKKPPLNTTQDQMKKIEESIERSFKAYMRIDEIILALQDLKLEGEFLRLIYHKLEEDHKELFEEFNHRLAIFDQIKAFNYLVSQQFQLMQSNATLQLRPVPSKQSIFAPPIPVPSSAPGAAPKVSMSTTSTTVMPPPPPPTSFSPTSFPSPPPPIVVDGPADGVGASTFPTSPTNGSKPEPFPTSTVKRLDGTATNLPAAPASFSTISLTGSDGIPRSVMESLGLDGEYGSLPPLFSS